MSAQLLTLGEAATQLRCTDWYLRRELAAGRLRGSKIGGRWLVTQQAIEAYVADRANVRPAPTGTRRRRRRAS